MAGAGGSWQRELARQLGGGGDGGVDGDIKAEATTPSGGDDDGWNFLFIIAFPLTYIGGRLLLEGRWWLRPYARVDQCVFFQ